MTERAAHLVDEVLPWVPVRQWVLTMPYRLRYQLAWNHGLSRAVLRVYTRALGDVYTRGARARGIEGGQTGMVTALQRAGGALNMNLHFHTLVLDGVFTEDPEGALTFHPAPGPSDAEVAAALATIRQRVQRLLVRHGLEPGDDATGPADRLAEESPVLAGIVGASVQGRVALGQRAGARVRRLGDARDTETVTSRGPRQAHLEGFDLHANVWVSGNDRAGLERLCRYILRPPFAQERLRLRSDGRVALELKQAWHDGTRELVFEPLELLERLAAMTPRPETNLLICHGLLAPRAPLARARGRVRTRGARAHGLDGAAGRRCGGRKGDERFARLELGGVDAPGIRDRCSGVPALWRSAAADRHAARSRRDPEAPRAPGDGPLRAEPRPRPTRVRRRRALKFGARRTPSCLRGEALSALIRPGHVPVDGGGVPA